MQIDAAILDHELPESAAWTDKDFAAAIWQYSLLLDLASGPMETGGAEWKDEVERVNDVLFLRDEIDAAAEHHGWHCFETFEERPTIEQLDARLRHQSQVSKKFRAFIAQEYEQFRDSVEPSEEDWWWWLDVT